MNSKDLLKTFLEDKKANNIFIKKLHNLLCKMEKDYLDKGTIDRYDLADCINIVEECFYE